MERYYKQMLFAPIGSEGQKDISQKKVVIVGAGALGSTVSETLARAGVGELIIIDRDFVDITNLQRQQLYTEKDVKNKMPKAIAAKKRLKKINSEIKVKAYIKDATPQVLNEIVQGAAVILDATDNFDIRFIINDIAHKHNIPWIYGAVIGSYGISFNVIPNESPCLNCLLKTIPLGIATCDTVGVISPAVQIVAAHQVTEALKILTNNYKSLRSKLITFDIWENNSQSIDVVALKDEACLTCGNNREYPYLSLKNQTQTAVLCGRKSVQIRPPHGNTNLSLNSLKNTFESLGLKTIYNQFLISCNIDDISITIFKDGRAIIHGTTDILLAKNIYHRFLG